MWIHTQEWKTHSSLPKAGRAKEVRGKKCVAVLRDSTVSIRQWPCLPKKGLHRWEAPCHGLVLDRHWETFWLLLEFHLTSKTLSLQAVVLWRHHRATFLPTPGHLPFAPTWVKELTFLHLLPFWSFLRFPQNSSRVWARNLRSMKMFVINILRMMASDLKVTEDGCSSLMQNTLPRIEMW